MRGVPFNATLCHCRDCRRVTGAPTVGWFSCRPAELVLTKSQPKRFTSSPGVTRGFCADCGTALTYERADLPDEVDITIGSLDRPDEVAPSDQTFHRHRLVWLDATGSLPTFPRARSDGSAGAA